MSRASGALRSARRTAIWLFALAAIGACAQDPVPFYAQQEPLRDDERERLARSVLEDANELWMKGRSEQALLTTARGLRLQPEAPGLLRLRAQLLSEMGRDEEARAVRSQVDAIDPPPAEPPSAPLGSGARRTIVLLPPPTLAPPNEDRVPRAWPRGSIARALEERLRTRLPGIEIVHASPESLAAARTLSDTAPGPLASLRVERAFFGSTRKDGSFAVGWLRAATDDARAEARIVRHSLDVLREGAADVRARAIERALEDALATEPLASWLADGAIPHAAERRALRALFPRIETTQRAAVERGRAALRRGSLERAVRLLREARDVDPGDVDTAALLADVEATLAIASQLDATTPTADVAAGPTLPLQLSAGQRQGLEHRLAEARSERQLLLGAVEALAGPPGLPGADTLAALRSVELPDPPPTGAALATERGGHDRLGVLLAPDGRAIARFYFRSAGPNRGADPSGFEGLELVLREEDNDSDGQPDRWIAFDGPAVRDLWIDRRGRGKPDLHWRYRGADREPERLAIDEDLDGRPEREFLYLGGQVREQRRDRDRDGRMDVFESLDAEGHLTRREEDLDGNGEIDLRSFYRNGRLERRELIDPGAAQALDPRSQPQPRERKRRESERRESERREADRRPRIPTRQPSPPTPRWG